MYSSTCTFIQNLLEKYKNKTIYLSGDFNAHHPIWSKGNENKKGKALLKMLILHNLSYLNDKDKPTHYNYKEKIFTDTISR